MTPSAAVQDDAVLTLMVLERAYVRWMRGARLDVRNQYYSPTIKHFRGTVAHSPSPNVNAASSPEYNKTVTAVAVSIQTEVGCYHCRCPSWAGTLVTVIRTTEIKTKTRCRRKQEGDTSRRAKPVVGAASGTALRGCFWQGQIRYFRL